jgi:hypothetical protein
MCHGYEIIELGLSSINVARVARTVGATGERCRASSALTSPCPWFPHCTAAPSVYLSR